MSVKKAILVLGFLLLYFEATAKRPPSQGAKVNRVKGQQESELVLLDDSSLTLQIEHSIGRGNEFYQRGTLHLKSLKSSSAPSSFQQLPLPSANLTSLRLAAKYGGYYFIRARTKFTDLLSDTSGSLEGDHVITFISACALVNARLSDLITVNGDGQGNVIGLTLTTPVVVTGMDCDDADQVSLPDQFNTSVSVDNGMVGPMPNSQAFFQKAEAEKENKDGKDNRSFLQKYWLYLVIGFVIFTFVNNAAGGGGGGGGQ